MKPDDPPPKVYGFKERAFQRDNAPASAMPPLPTAKELATMAGPPVHKPGLPAVGSAKAGDPNDVFVHLQQNRAGEKQAGADQMEIRETKSRRKRDFWLLLVGGNLAIVAGVAFSGFNVISAIFGLAGLVIFSLGTSWVMWQVMDKY